jgi:hypothetical protein
MPVLLMAVAPKPRIFENRAFGSILKNADFFEKLKKKA